MPHRSDVRRITHALNWIGVCALAFGMAVVVWALWWTDGVDDFRTAVIVAALGFGLPSVVALTVAWLLDPLTDSDRPEAEAAPAEVALAVVPQKTSRTDPRNWARFARYAVAVGAVIAAALVRFWLDPILGARAPFITFFLAVAVAAWVGGFGASAVATALSTIIAWRWFMRGPADLPPDLLGNTVAAGVFIATALVIGGITAAMRATAGVADRLAAMASARNAEPLSAGPESSPDRANDDERIRTMADGAPTLIWLADASGSRTHFNRRWLEFTGRALESAVGLQWADAVHPEDREECLRICNAAFMARTPFRARYRLCRFDGEYRSVFEEGVPRFAADGAFAGYVGACMTLDDAAEGGLEAPAAESRGAHAPKRA